MGSFVMYSFVRLCISIARSLCTRARTCVCIFLFAYVKIIVDSVFHWVHFSLRFYIFSIISIYFPFQRTISDELVSHQTHWCVCVHACDIRRNFDEFLSKIKNLSNFLSDICPNVFALRSCHGWQNTIGFHYGPIIFDTPAVNDRLID